jgi:hypothetical protein
MVYKAKIIYFVGLLLTCAVCSSCARFTATSAAGIKSSEFLAQALQSVIKAREMKRVFLQSINDPSYFPKIDCSGNAGESISFTNQYIIIDGVSYNLFYVRWETFTTCTDSHGNDENILVPWEYTM